jgi:hypothetical protein
MANGAPMCLVCVFDGLRPDLVRPDWTPNLWELRRRGVWFSRSHCVFPSVTRVNSAALATGCFPGTHGLEGNSIWRPDVEPSRRIRTSEVEDLHRLRDRHGRVVRPLTAAETLAATGLRTVAIGTGSSGGTYLIHPEAAGCGGLVYHHTFTDPPELCEKVRAALGPAPAGGDRGALAMARIEYAARALAEVLIPAADPALATFWITLPDGLHHRFGLGAPQSVAAIRGVDDVFGRLLRSLDERRSGRPLNVFVTADHGYATVSGHVDVADELVRAGLKRSSESTDIVTCADGGASLLYTEPSVDLERVATFLLGRPWVGAVVARDGVPGTVPLAAVGCAGPNAPALIAAMAWEHSPNSYGVPGLSWGQGGIAVGAGDHGGISPYEMHNTLIAAGPGFRQGFESDTPCGIVDIAPTVLHCLGVTSPPQWNGRVLVEAMDGGEPAPPVELQDVVVTFDGGRQVLTLARAGAVSYASGSSMVRE